MSLHSVNQIPCSSTLYCGSGGTPKGLVADHRIPFLRCQANGIPDRRIADCSHSLPGAFGGTHGGSDSLLLREAEQPWTPMELCLFFFPHQQHPWSRIRLHRDLISISWYQCDVAIKPASNANERPGVLFCHLVSHPQGWPQSSRLISLLPALGKRPRFFVFLLLDLTYISL